MGAPDFNNDGRVSFGEGMATLDLLDYFDDEDSPEIETTSRRPSRKRDKPKKDKPNFFALFGVACLSFFLLWLFLWALINGPFFF